MKIREAALRMQSANKMKQIALATHNYASEHEGRLPNIEGDERGPNKGLAMFVAILPYIEQDAIYNVLSRNRFGNDPFPIPAYISPADPTVNDNRYGLIVGISSYGANAQVFTASPRMPQTFQDGSSNTIAFAEHYAVCKGTRFYSWTTSPDDAIHRATFVDGGRNVDSGANCGDYYPVTSGNPPVTVGISEETFQVRPTPVDEKCKPQLAQTPHSAGMLAALGDGSIRTLAPGMSNSTYWSAITPAGGEVLGADW
jgi:hypothetical protein